MYKIKIKETLMKNKLFYLTIGTVCSAQELWGTMFHFNHLSEIGTGKKFDCLA